MSVGSVVKRRVELPTNGYRVQYFANRSYEHKDSLKLHPQKHGIDFYLSVLRVEYLVKNSCPLDPVEPYLFGQKIDFLGLINT